jgi:hypothetical protein
MSDIDDFEREAVLVGAITTALREELGAQIEDQPGFHDPSEAVQVNRAFRVVARTILAMTHISTESLERRTSLLLAHLARRRLDAGSLEPGAVEYLLVMELAGRDDWLAFLILTDWLEIMILLQEPDSPSADR